MAFSDKCRIKKGFSLVLALFFAVVLVFAYPVNCTHSENIDDFSNKDINKIEEYIEMYMKKGRIPGIAVSVVHDDNEKFFCYGVSNKEDTSPVTPHTKFELGSNTKAFTAIGIIRLESEGKLHLDDKVSAYFPDLDFYYNGAADKLSSAVKVNEDGTYSVDPDKLLAAAKDFVSSYNSTKEAAAKSDNVNVLKKASFMVGSTSANEKLLEKVGITVNKDNSLSLNEETLKNADARFVKSVFGGENSYASRISQKASQFSTLAETPKSTYQTYSASGIEEWIASYTSGSSLNLLV